MRNWSVQSQVAVKTYWLITALFGCFYGLYGYYAFAYLDSLEPGSGRIFEALLIVLAATMLFEFIAEPITGRYADAYGRRQATTIAFGLVTVAFLIYASISFPPFHSSLAVVVVFALMAEFVLAFGLAFHSGSLDSWVVEQVYHAEESKEIKTEPVFGIAGIVFAIGLTLGGVTGAFAVPAPGTKAALWPWFLSAFLSMLTILIVAITMHDSRPSAVESSIRQRKALDILVEALGRTLQIRKASGSIITAIVVTSMNYIVGIVFIYFSLLAAKELLSSRVDLAWLSTTPIILLVPRIIGPWLAMRLTTGCAPSEQIRYKTIMAVSCVALGLAASLLGASIWTSSKEVVLKSSSLQVYAVYLAILFAFITSILHNMLKPIASSYLNYHIADDSERAFLNSMSTPFGGIVVAIMCVVLLILNPGASIPRGHELGVVFIIPGSVVFLAGIGLFLRRRS